MAYNYGDWSDYDKSLLRGGISSLGKSIGEFFSPYHSPADAAMPYLDNASQQLPGHYNPYIERGQRAGTSLEEQYMQLLNDPGARLNKIGEGYKQSPGYNFQLQQALASGNHAAAAGGMAGTPQHQQQNMEIASGIASKDYNDWLSHALGLYGLGSQEAQNMSNTGYNASNELAQSLANIQMSKAKLAQESANEKNSHESGKWGDFLGGIADLAAFKWL